MNVRPISQTTSPQFEWFVRRTGDADYRTLHRGYTSEDVLGNLFAMWLTHEEDVSDWEDVAAFGAVVSVHSDLETEEFAVWPGIEFVDPLQAATPDDPDGWTFTGPEGRDFGLTRTRRRTRNER